MGGIKSTVEKKTPSPKSIRNYINHKKFTIITCCSEEVNENNYKEKLKNYNLTLSDFKKIKVGFKCKAKKNQFIKKHLFFNKGGGLFQMECCNLNITTNAYEKRIVKIKKYILQYKVDNPDDITEIKKKGWGILFFYRKTTQISSKRSFTLKEIEKIRELMKKSLEQKLLSEN